MGKSSRRKGHDFERALCRWFRSRGIEARRGLQSRGGGAEQADVILPGLPYHVEAKRPARCAVYGYMDQAMQDAEQDGNGNKPVVLLRADGRPALAIMLADDWIEKIEKETR